MKILVASPTFPPDCCGIGDVTYRLTDALSKNHEVTVITGQQSPSVMPAMNEPGNLKIIPITRNWNTKGFDELLETISFLPRHDAYLITYAPYLYNSDRLGRFGIVPELPGFIYSAKKRNYHFSIYMHETYQSFGASATGLTIALPQWIIYNITALGARGIISTIEKWKTAFDRCPLYRKNKTLLLPSGSSIIPSNDRKKRSRELVESLGLDPDAPESFVLTVFGKSLLSGRLVEHLNLAWKKCSDRLKNNVRLVLVGIDKEEARDRFEVPPSLCTGNISSKDVSAWFCATDLLLAPYTDGVSLRRSSVFSAIEHSVAVATNRGRLTDPSVDYEKFMFICDEPSPEAFSDYVLGIIEKGKIPLYEMGNRARKEFKENYSWEILSGKLAGFLDQRNHDSGDE